VSRRDPSISHLLFADDSIMFFKLDGMQARNVQELLAVFERSTGQELSPSKCPLLVHEGVDNGYQRCSRSSRSSASKDQVLMRSI
jgi:hypothetical protein